MQLHKLAGFTACTELAFTTALEKKKEKTKIQLTLLPLHYHVFIVQSRIWQVISKLFMTTLTAITEWREKPE